MTRSDFLPYRQIHLDFHTSEAITGIGADFDPDEFGDTLVKAHVNSITCFARGHHGWLYYDSERFPERVHPHLERRNLLKEQIEACHARGIRVPIYVTVQWDYYTSSRHPEWLLTDAEGHILGTPPFEAGFYRWMNVNSPYVDFLKENVQEIMESLPTDGIFFDIVQPIPSTDRYTQEKMRAAGLDPADPSQRNQFALTSLNAFKTDMSEFVRAINPECDIFYNAGHVGTRHRAVKDAYSHWELESLPSGAWGYQHFPIAMRYARTLGLDCVTHTGKFHTAWGDFHSFKNQAALEYECFRMIAMGSKCEIGDQLPPRGRIEGHVYELVGKVYAQVAEKEPWCRGAEAISEIGLFTPEEFAGLIGGMAIPPAIKGATRMLEEGGHQFDIVDSSSDLSGYKVVILPDTIPVDQVLAHKLSAFVGAGGALLASFESGLDPDKIDFALPELGVSKIGEGPRDLEGELARGRVYPRGDYVDYILPQGQIGNGLPPTEHVMYIRGLEVAARTDARVLAPLIPAYFDRTYEHFCSHRQTPSAGQPGNPGIVRNGQSIYFANPIFSQYNQNAPLWCKTLLLNALAMLLPDPLVRHEGPSSLLVTLNQQEESDRWVLHLLHYIPERRGLDFDVIEDVIPLYDVAISLLPARPVARIVTAPQGEALDFEESDGRVQFSLPKLDGHQMIAVEFGS